MVLRTAIGVQRTALAALREVIRWQIGNGLRSETSGGRVEICGVTTAQAIVVVSVTEVGLAIAAIVAVLEIVAVSEIAAALVTEVALAIAAIVVVLVIAVASEIAAVSATEVVPATEAIVAA